MKKVHKKFYKYIEETKKRSSERLRTPPVGLEPTTS